jgi:SP family general alpha glucoside:H+ symporter-like MFS transporter
VGICCSNSAWCYFGTGISLLVSFFEKKYELLRDLIVITGWLVRQERPGEAKKALLRLTKKGKDCFNVDETVAMMKHTNEVEKFLGSGRMSFRDCFKGTDLRRTEIACMVWVTQQACFSGSGAYAAYFYEQAGFSIENSWNLAVGMSGLAITGGVMSWFLMPRIGRRRLYLYGLFVSAVTLIIAGSIGARPETHAQSWAVGSLLIFLTFIYDLTIGPVCYILVAEIPSTRLRAKTVVLARVAYNVVSIITNTITARMLNPTAWNLKGKSCFFNLGITILCLIWCYWRLPETFGLSYLEIDILFEKKANVSKFRELRAALDSMGYFSLSNDERQGSIWRGY